MLSKLLSFTIIIVYLIITSCAPIPYGLMQDAKTLERGEFEIRIVEGLGTEMPAAVLVNEKSQSNWDDNANVLGPLRLVGRLYSGIIFRTGLFREMDFSQELLGTFGLTGGLEFISKSRIKYSPIHDNKRIQLAILPTFIAVAGPQDNFDDDTTDDDVQFSFDAIGAEIPFVISFHFLNICSPYFAISPGFLQLEFDHYDLHEIPETLYPVSLNFHLGVNIKKRLFTIAPEIAYNAVFYKGNYIYDTVSIGIAGGVRLKKRKKDLP